MWKKLLAAMRLVVRTMPRDVSTRWNSTFTMLNFALEYRSAIDSLTGDHAADIRKLEVDDEEWELLKQLRDVLKVSLVTVSH